MVSGLKVDPRAPSSSEVSLPSVSALWTPLFYLILQEVQSSDHVYSIHSPLPTPRALDPGLLSLLASPSHHSHWDTVTFWGLIQEPDRVVRHGDQEGGAKLA